MVTADLYFKRFDRILIRFKFNKGGAMWGLSVTLLEIFKIGPFFKKKFDFDFSVKSVNGSYLDKL